MATLETLEAELDQQKELLSLAEQALETLPDDEDSLGDKAYAESQIKQLEGQITALKTAPAPPTELKVGDHVLAKWSEDKQFYTASIITITGSSSEPIYTVKFKDYGNTETVRKHDIKQVVKKRKAESPPPPPPPQPHIITAAPIVEKKREPSMVSDGPTRLAKEPKKLKNSGQLNKSKNSWLDWQKNGPKGAKEGIPKAKDSMFRTGELPGSKVGFVGSGKGMQKDQVKQRTRYDQLPQD